ncbi:hypothetical protein M422DRAFT_257434 [Sphaerobolus stellatus SS14]|uniref:Uncharacterized protein n=1 Tax=Sphaerobolus stellatus (strain SS14) TaxID=990650 RepID=A0A0C9U9R6_SPHS4|nr:hypothetical protein M422DRAFT_257434 [Sphaerobolus stellatus SS14]
MTGSSLFLNAPDSRLGILTPAPSCGGVSIPFSSPSCSSGRLFPLQSCLATTTDDDSFKAKFVAVLSVDGMHNKAALKIADIIFGDRLVEMGFGNPLTDPAVPDIIVQPELGTIYTTSHKKIAEHGGLSVDDRHIACFASNPGLKKTTFGTKVQTTQIAPVILKMLGLDPNSLQGVRAEGTKPLPGF